VDKLTNGLLVCGLGVVFLLYAVAKIGTSQFQYASVMMSLYSWHSNVLPPQALNFSYMFWNFYTVFASIIAAVVILPIGLVLLLRATTRREMPGNEIGIRKTA
jgi:hypothetical protein